MCTSNPGETTRGDVGPQRRLGERVLAPVDSMRTSFERNGVSISFETTGSGASVTLVHGVGSNLESWDNVVPALAARSERLADGRPARPFH